MTARAFHGRRRRFTASGAADVQGNVLITIKIEDGATWKDMGRVLGKSEDRAAVCGSTSSAIDLPTFLAACHEWGGRFADPLLALADGRWAEAGSLCTGDDPASLTLAQLLPTIIAAELDGDTTAAEVAPQEALIRRVHQVTGRWLDMITAETAAGC